MEAKNAVLNLSFILQMSHRVNPVSADGTQPRLHLDSLAAGIAHGNVAAGHAQGGLALCPTHHALLVVIAILPLCKLSCSLQAQWGASALAKLGQTAVATPDCSMHVCLADPASFAAACRCRWRLQSWTKSGQALVQVRPSPCGSVRSECFLNFCGHPCSLKDSLRGHITALACAQGHSQVLHTVRHGSDRPRVDVPGRGASRPKRKMLQSRSETPAVSAGLIAIQPCAEP